MLAKLFKGELSLAETFWKFGVGGLIVLKLAVQGFGFLLNQHLQGRTIYNFFFYHFNPITSSKLSILWTVCYVSGVLVLAAYSWNIMVAVWRSAKNYDKSPILAFLARVGIIAMVMFIWSSVLLKVIM